MKNIEAELIINTGSRKGKLLRDDILNRLYNQGFAITAVSEINRKNSFDTAIQSVLKRKPKILIACGGDGTISDVVDHIVGHDIEIGLIPIGTTNNFARSLDLPFDMDGAVKMIKNSKSRHVDLGKINDDYFTNVAGIGLSSLVAKNVSDRDKKRWGRLAYAVTGLKELVRHKPFMVTIEDKDHELKLNFETHQVIIANGRYHAGREIAVDAKVDNRELILFSLGGRTKLSFVWGMLDFYVGKRKYVRHASFLTAKNITLETDSIQLVELDGEVKFETPVQAQVAPRAIKIRY